MSKTRMGKRVASLLLSLVMMLSLLPTTVYAEGADTGDTTDEIVGQATTSGDNTEGTGEPEPTGEGEDGAATNDAVVEETIAPVNAEGVDAVANAESNGDEVSGEDGNELVNFVTVNGDATEYETLEKAIEAADPDADGVITYNISGKVSVTATGWIQVAKAGLTDLTAVKFVGKTVDAGICINGGLAILADQNYDIDVSFEALTLSKQYPTYGGDYGHSTNYFTTWLRNSNAAENTVTYTNCTFPNGVSNNQYGKTVFDNCKFTNSATGLYNLWSYGGNTEVKNSTFTGTRGIKAYSEGTDGGSIKVAGTKFDNLTQKAAIVASKPVNVEVSNVDVTGEKGFFTRDITGNDEVQLTVAGTGISGTFKITSATDAGAAKDEFNISAGTFTSKVSNDYCADGFEIKASTDASGNTTYGVVEAATAAAQIGETTYETLQAAINAATAGQTVTLLADATEDVTINKNITLDLGGKTLTNTNAGKATVTIAKGATATVQNGSVKGGTSYYNIQNNGTATLEDVTATAGNIGSSMLDNWGTLTITSGTYTGGLDTVKSEEGSVLTINGGKFISDYAPKYDITGVVMAYGTTTINGGEFIQNSTTTGSRVIVTGIVEGYTSITYVKGGSFTSKGGAIFHGIGKATSDNFEVSGGTFNKKVSESYCADGFIPNNTKDANGYYGVKEGKYVAKSDTTKEKYDTLQAAIKATSKGKTVTLLTDVTENVEIIKGKKVTLDLNGFTLNGGTGTAKAALTNYGTITIKDSSEGKTGTIKRDDNGIPGETSYYVIDNHGTMTIEGGNVSNNSGYEQENPSGSMVGSSLIRNGENDGGATLNITGGKLEQQNFIAIKNSALGTLHVTGGTITSKHSAIQNWFEATITGGEINGQLWTDAWKEGESVGKTTIGGDATFTGEIVMDITGSMVPTLAINGGNLDVTNWRITKAAADAGAKPAVSGGTFKAAVPENYCADGYIPAKNGDGTYGVKKGSYVAETNNVKYESLQAAIDAARKNATVTMLADTKENVTISTPYLTLDLNGFTLNGSTGERKPALTITARVTVKDSSDPSTGTIMREDTAENSGVSSHYVIDVQGAGWLTFESGNVKNNSGNVAGKGASLVRVGDDSVAKYPGLNIKGGTFTQNNFIVIKVDSGDLFLNGGTLNSANSYAIENWHRATVKGGTVNGTVAAWTYSGGHNSTLEISGGTIKGNVASVSYDKAEGKLAKVSITGGTVTGTLGTYTYNNGLESITDAAKATIKITGGTFSKDPAKYVVEDSAVTENEDNTFGVAKAYLARIGETFYYTMEDAFQAQTNGDTIVLLRDYTTGGTFNSGSINRTVDLNGHTWTCTGTDANSAAFEINYPNASLTVKNGKIVSSQLVGLIPSASGGTITYDNSSLTFENVKMSTTATSGIETNGNNTNDTVTLKNSTLNVPNGFGIYFPSSGTLTIDNSTITAKTMGVQVCAGSLSISGDQTAITVSGDAVPKTENDGAIQDGAAISIVNRAGYKGLGNVTVTGGKFTAKTGNEAIKAYDWANNTESAFTANEKVFVSGGTFSSIPDNMDGLCKDGFVPVKNADGYAVQTGTYVASIGTKKFATLAEAVEAAKDGDAVKLLGDVVLAETLIIKDKTITLDLNGRTISNSADIWNESKYAWSLISVRDNGDLTINDTTGGGTLKAKENDCFALDVYAYDTKNVEDTKLTINAGNYVGNISAVYAFTGKATINGGHFSIQQKESGSDPYRLTLNCYDSSYTAGRAGFTVNGGTFENFDPRNNPAEGAGTSFVAESVGVDKNTDGTFTAKPNMAAQIVDAGGGSVAAYAGHCDAIAAAKDGETVILLSDRKNFVTNTINANITIDLNGKTLSVGNNNPFFRTNGEVTIQNGTIESNYACAIVNAYNKLTLKNVKITGVTGDSGKNLVNVCSNAEVTIDKDTVLTASGSGVAVFIGQNADAKYTLNVYGKVIQQNKSYAISGNGSYKGATTINIYEGAEVRSASVAIYHPQAGEINVYGGLVEGYCGIGIKSGTLNITGGQVLGVHDDDELSDENSNPNGMTYDGSAIIIDSRAAYAGNVKINISGDALVQSSYSTAIREIGESAETTNVTALNVTGGKVLGASGKAAIQLHGVTADVTSISGGTFSSKVPAEYCAPGYVPTSEDADGRFTVAEGEFTVQVTSRTVSSASPVAHVSGGGRGIKYAEGTTATTTTVAGYEFVGWYVDNYPDGDYLGKKLTISYNPTADCTLVAVYEPISGGTFELKVDASKFKVNGGATNTSKFSGKLAANSLVTIKFTGDNFLYWVNGSGKVVSTLTEYTFTLVSATVLSAVYTNSEADEAQVIFLTANPDDPNSAPQIVSSRAYAKNTTTISFPAPPVRIGKSFTGWSMTEKQIIDAIPGANVERGGKILVYAMYEDQKRPCTVTVFYGDRQQEIPATIGTRVELTAPQQVDGKEFSCWKDSEGKVLGTTSKLYVTPVGNMTVYAVYGETVEQLPTISMLKPVASVANEKYVVTFSAVRSIPNGYTIEELGILYSMDSGYGNSDAEKYMVLGSDGEVPAGVYRARATQTTPLGTVRCNITTGFADRTFYARGYMILKDSEGNIAPYYSEIASGSYNSLTNGGN